MELFGIFFKKEQNPKISSAQPSRALELSLSLEERVANTTQPAPCDVICFCEEIFNGATKTP